MRSTFPQLHMLRRTCIFVLMLQLFAIHGAGKFGVSELLAGIWDSRLEAGGRIDALRCPARFVNIWIW